MTLLLVRHVEAEARSGWDGPDTLRPASPKGRRQASALVQVLGDRFVLSRLMSSPSLRCIETLSPMAAVLGLSIEVSESLSEGRRPEAATDLVRLGAASPGDAGAVVLCSHGDTIPAILHFLQAADDLDLGHQPRCQKGSTWVLEGKRGRFSTATYVPPP